MAKILDGRKVSAMMREDIKQRVLTLEIMKGVSPGLAIVVVGNDAASKVYVRNKLRACSEVGFITEVYKLPAETTQQELSDLICVLNEKPTVHGIIVQLPLPSHLDESLIPLIIDPDKDVDAFHPYNVGNAMLGTFRFLPCTPAGVMELLRLSDIDVDGKECVVVGRSNIVGKPQALLLLQENGTVTVCHSHTKNLQEVCKRADILVTAIGKPEFIDASYVKEGAVVIDVGINRRSDGKLCGDVNFEDVEPIASAITPVPGGVGPMTITMLLWNTLRAAEWKAYV